MGFRWYESDPNLPIPISLSEKLLGVAVDYADTGLLQGVQHRGEEHSVLPQ